MIEVTEKPINPNTLYEYLKRDRSGSVVLHYAVVKDITEGKSTAGIRFSAKGDLKGELQAIEDAARKKWKLEDFVLIRRLGNLKIGDLIMAVAVSATGRDDAFGACRDAVDSAKKLKNIKKEELFT